ncbi:hypothetical protein M595_5702 [Lyngbya aestuarii BL J]|uniref:Uncharacterized protein n=1 Tax=Lyngbya aestuarii BL J TaxID=1348334 RepID=U7QAW2_9CYAN|nr:hypothetical protein [Lyngbya aestuarii]ERT04347.1 hypothetical protein M595_5702 [Lyngbya aestuarii BL J]
MIFIIPIVLGAAAVGSAALGVGKGVSGISKKQKADKIVKNAQQRHDVARERAEQEWKTTEQLAEEYGQLQIDVKSRTIGRFFAFIERNGQKGSLKDKRFLEGLEGFSIEDIKKYKVEAYKKVTGGVKAAGVGGMAIGTAVSGGIVAGPALAVVGFVLASEGNKKLTKTREYESKIDVDIAKIEEAQEYIKVVKKQIIEFKNLLKHLNKRAVLALKELESKPFDRDRDAAKFQKLGLLVKAMLEIMKTPVLDNQGHPNPIIKNLREKYRYL